MTLTKTNEIRIPVSALYVVIAVLGVGTLAFLWREAPAIIRYVKSELM